MGYSNEKIEKPSNIRLTMLSLYLLRCSVHLDFSKSELELQMRKLSKRIRVVEKLSGGAHLLLPSESSIAVRTYYPSDLQKLNKAVDWKAKFAAWNHDGPQLGEDPENLAGFRDSFQFPFVFFVLPSFQSTAENIDHAGSFLHQAQIIMNGWSRSNTTKSNVRIK